MEIKYEKLVHQVVGDEGWRIYLVLMTCRYGREKEAREGGLSNLLRWLVVVESRYLP